MRGVCIGIAVAAGTALASTAASSEPKVTSSASTGKTSVFMRVFGPAQPPYGFVRFCEIRPQSCTSVTIEESRFQPTAEHLSELDEINRSINRAIAPATDQEIYGVSELWTLPGEKGDCEDYALLKQKTLLQRGWPSSALLLTVVRDEKGEGHAVLTVRTAQGDYILDNKVDDVRLWNRAGYEFMMRQSYIDPKVWVSLEDTSANASPAMVAARASR